MPGKLTPKQKRALELLPRALAGEMTIEEALRRAGYSEATARQEKSVMDSLRQSSAMQVALRQEKVTEERIAKRINEGIDSESDKTALGFTKLAAELLDVFPAQKSIVAEVGVAELLDGAENSADYADWEPVTP